MPTEGDAAANVAGVTKRISFEINSEEDGRTTPDQSEMYLPPLPPLSVDPSVSTSEGVDDPDRQRKRRANRRGSSDLGGDAYIGDLGRDTPEEEKALFDDHHGRDDLSRTPSDNDLYADRVRVG